MRRLGNKQDSAKAMDEPTLRKKLKLKSLTKTSGSPIKVFLASAVLANRKTDPALKQGARSAQRPEQLKCSHGRAALKWLLGQVKQEYRALSERIAEDSAAQREREQREKEERKQRAEERRKQQQGQEKGGAGAAAVGGAGRSGWGGRRKVDAGDSDVALDSGADMPAASSRFSVSPAEKTRRAQQAASSTCLWLCALKSCSPVCRPGLARKASEDDAVGSVGSTQGALSARQKKGGREAESADQLELEQAPSKSAARKNRRIAPADNVDDDIALETRAAAAGGRKAGGGYASAAAAAGTGSATWDDQPVGRSVAAGKKSAASWDDQPIGGGAAGKSRRARGGADEDDESEPRRGGGKLPSIGSSASASLDERPASGRRALPALEGPSASGDASRRAGRRPSGSVAFVV
jgi:hypothetical protein